MLSPWKLYKHDMKHQRVPVTWGPRGKPAKGCKGSYCYRHKHIDWTIHRLTPAVHRASGEHTQKAISKGMQKFSDSKVVEKKLPLAQSVPSDMEHHELGEYLTAMSPRWGPGNAPGRRSRRVVLLPDHEDLQVSKKAKVVTGTAGAGGVDYYYRHRHGKQERVHKTRRANGNHGVKPYH